MLRWEDKGGLLLIEIAKWRISILLWVSHECGERSKSAELS